LYDLPIKRALTPTNYIGDGVFKALRGQPLGIASTEMLALAVVTVTGLVAFLVISRRKELSE
jgi:hypothetical protein